MCSVPFNIPSRKEDLLVVTAASYCVKDVLDKSDITSKLKVAKNYCHNDGPAFILDYFDVYYSIFHLSKQLPTNVVTQAFDSIRQSLNDIPQAIGSILESNKNNLNEDNQMQWQNIVSMHVYIYVELAQAITANIIDKKDTSLRASIKGKAKASTEDEFDWYKCIKAMQRILDCGLLSIWTRLPSPLTNKFMELIFLFLENYSKKRNTDTLELVWAVCGVLMAKYNIADTLVLRFVLTIKEHEHVSALLGEGICYMINTFRMPGLYKALLRELIEWQISELNTESNSVKHCCKVVYDMSIKLPDLLLPELKYLNTYLKFTSYNLRNMVLAIQVELLLAKFTRDDLSEDDRQIRDDIIQHLLNHAFDKSALVRAKIMQHYAHLQEENAIPKGMIAQMLQKCVVLLQDVTANVRKNAIACIRTMITHNMYGPVLSLRDFQKKFRDVQTELVKLKFSMFGLDMEAQEAKEALWAEHVAHIKEYLSKHLDNDNDEDSQDEDEEADKENESENHNSQNKDVTQDATPASIRELIMANNYRKAFEICRERAKDEVVKKIVAVAEVSTSVGVVDQYAMLMYILFMEIPEIKMETASEEQYSRLSTLENSVDYLNSAIQFCKLLAESCVLIHQLLNTINISDMQESAEFVLIAYQFQLDDCVNLISNVLKAIVSNDPGRQKVVLNILKKAYLITDFIGESHATAIVERLIELMVSITHDRVDGLICLMSQWAEQGMVGNDILELIWKYYLRSIDIPVHKARAALMLLRMAADGKDSIIQKNYRLVTIKSSQDCKNDHVQLVTESFKFLSILTKEPTDMIGKSPPFRIPLEDEIWENILAAMQHLFQNRSRFVNCTITGCVRLIFGLCAKPIQVASKLLRIFLDFKTPECPTYMLVRFNLLIGEIILNYMIFLDNDVYKEMKRRQQVANEQKNKKCRASMSTLHLDPNNSTRSVNTSTATQSLRNRDLCNTSVDKNESIMEGAEAIDEDVDIIMHQLEASISMESMLGPCFEHIVSICQQPNKYPEEIVQNSAMTAILRGMLISATVCKANIRMVLKILMSTKFVQMKITILIHMVDLLEKSPNIIEPHTVKLYTLLNDESLKVRAVVLEILALLILKDMIRPQEHLWRMARCAIDPISMIRDSAKAFFARSVQKSNNLYNYLPDIFTNLYLNTSEEELRSILIILFELIQVPKQIETLVERFCIKYENHTDEVLATNITFALSLMKYSERAMQKLVENFQKFKHFILVDGVYNYFNQIIAATCKTVNLKKEVKLLTTQLEELMNEVRDASDKPRETASKFKRPLPVPAKKTKRAKPAPRSAQKRRQLRDDSSSDDEDDDDYDVSIRRTNTVRRTRSKFKA